MLKFMSIFAEDERFLKLNLDGKKEGEITMCTILDAAEQRGISQGISRGINQGKTIGEDAILKLVKILIANNQIKQIERIYEDREYRQQLMEKYKIYH